MYVTLRITNRQLFIDGASRKLLRAVDKATRYAIAGAQFAPAFRSKRWDGMEHLLRFSAKQGYHMPSGLVVDVIRVLKHRRQPYIIKDETVVRHERRAIQWNKAIVLRDYQHAAVRAAFAPPLPGMAILKMPIRSGKTKTGARIIQKLGLPTLFVVPSQMLLGQTVAALQEALPGIKIGQIGDGQNEIGFVTVATIQSLQRRYKSRASKSSTWKAFVKSFDLLIVDEAHHFGGNSSWHSVIYQIDAKYKIALSATVFLKNESQIELGVIWIMGIFGPVRIDVNTSSLVEQGYLMRQNVEMHHIAKPNLDGQRWSQTLLKAGITNNVFRNKKIASLAESEVALGRKVLIIANRIEHIGQIVDELETLGLDCRVITGADNSESREDKVEAFKNGVVSILVGTVLSEGVDLPSVETVINAEGGKSDIKTIQRQRNLTIAHGKTKSVMIDFFDDTNSYFRKHSQARLDAYSSEPAFVVNVIR